MDARKQVVDYICRELLFDDRTRIPQPSEPLLSHAGGVVDSVGLQQLIAFIQSQFGIGVKELDIVPENFETLDAVVSYIKRKRAAESPVV